MKKCNTCKQEKPKSNFAFETKAPDGLHRQCRYCKSVRDRQRSYGMDDKHYLFLLHSQKHCCAMCGINPKESKEYHYKDLCVDHDHSTHKVRGLLCHNCNRGIGFLQHDITILENAIKYLNK